MTWTDGKYFEGNMLLERWQINELLKAFKHKKREQFVTIQDYDQEGNIIGCPLYFDIDSPSLMDAHEEAKDLVERLEDQYNVTPFVWFSGGKGFHVMAPLYIRHHRCHEIVKMIWEDLFKQVECDPSVYRTRSMLRCDNTWNIKGERFKSYVPEINYPLDKIVKNAETQTPPAWRLRWGIPTDLPIQEYIDRLPEFKVGDFEADSNFVSDMMPCLKNLWTEETPPQGTRHELAHLMVRHCFRSELSREDTISLFANHPFWSQVNPNDYVKIVRSIYQNGKAVIGCKNNEYLLSNCVKFCKYNKGMSITDTFKRGNNG